MFSCFETKIGGLASTKRTFRAVRFTKSELKHTNSVLCCFFFCLHTERKKYFTKFKFIITIIGDILQSQRNIKSIKFVHFYASLKQKVFEKIDQFFYRFYLKEREKNATKTHRRPLALTDACNQNKEILPTEHQVWKNPSIDTLEPNR